MRLNPIPLIASSSSPRMRGYANHEAESASDVETSMIWCEQAAWEIKRFAGGSGMTRSSICHLPSPPPLNAAQAQLKPPIKRRGTHSISAILPSLLCKVAIKLKVDLALRINPPLRSSSSP